MSIPPFSDQDLTQIQEHGLSEEQVLSQIEAFKKPPPYVRLNRPCTLGDGVRKLPEETHPGLIRRHEHAAIQGRFMKFVPASGAATRMFKSLLWFHSDMQHLGLKEACQMAESGDERAENLLAFLTNLDRFAFFEDLQITMAKDGLDISTHLQEQRYQVILDYLLTHRGLNYGHLPKGLLKFHRYPDGGRTALEEHLVEATKYARDADQLCRLHFTVSQEHLLLFEELFHQTKPLYENAYQTRFAVDFSFQSPSTDTIAVDLENRPFRHGDGRLLFRPGGHGALIENLNQLQADLVLIKNIDNVVPDPLKERILVWKKILAGYLIEIQSRIFSWIEEIKKGVLERPVLEKAFEFARMELSLSLPESPGSSLSDAQGTLLSALERPLRVCGVVRNVGEPGGGPFWVEEPDGSQSLQIVEKAQVNLDVPHQREIWSSATHFNPVDIVCGVLDHSGKPFDLARYVDPDAYLVTHKSQEGRDLKAMEHPGLWNGAMSRWNTLFVEVPHETFNPVKTVLDLLRKEHQPTDDGPLP